MPTRTELNLSLPVGHPDRFRVIELTPEEVDEINVRGQQAAAEFADQVARDERDDLIDELLERLITGGVITGPERAEIAQRLADHPRTRRRP